MRKLILVFSIGCLLALFAAWRSGLLAALQAPAPELLRNDGGVLTAGSSTAAPEKKVLDRRPVLATVGLDLEVLAPAFLMSEPKTAARIVPDAAELARALTLGGTDPAGADVAVLPLPTLIAHYERLRGLDPRIFFLTGSSRGREGLAAAPAGKDLAKLAGQKTALAGEAGSPATLFALEVLELSGVSPAAVHLVAPADRKSPLAAIELRGGRSGRKLGARRMLITSAEAPGLIPIVAIAPRRLLDKNPLAVGAWARSWLSAARRLAGDLPAEARVLASRPGAPPPAVLLERLGTIEIAGLRENARAFGLAGREPATLDAIFQRSWRVLREAGVLASAIPESVPIDDGPVIMLATTTTKAELVAPPPQKLAKAGPLLLSCPVASAEVEDALQEIGFLAAIFRRASLRVGSPGGAKHTRLLIDDAVARFAIDPERLLLDPSPEPGTRIQVLGAR